MYSPFMHIGRPRPQGETVLGLNARTRATGNVSNENKEKSRLSNARYCTKQKKEVSGDLFVSSPHTCPTVAGPTDCAGTWLGSSCVSIAF